MSPVTILQALLLRAGPGGFIGCDLGSPAKTYAGPAVGRDVDNAIDVKSYPFRADKDDRSVFLGRMTADKRPHVAADAAIDAGFSLLLAGKCTEEDGIPFLRR